MSTRETGLFGAPKDRAVWRGRSLSFIRQVRGLDAKYGTARQAMQASNIIGDDDPPVGAFCWYHHEPYDNITLALGHFQVLAVSLTGEPILTGIRAPYLGLYAGWSRNIGPDDEGASA